ncbi:MAG: ADP-ribosylation factor-like protein [Promethearchaeota archaeon]
MTYNINNSGVTDENVKKIVFTGLDSAGKTSIILALDRNVARIATTTPTRLVERSTLNFLDYKIVKHDLGGQKKYLINYLKNPGKFFMDTYVCIYVIDIQDRERFNESLSYFKDVLNKFEEIEIKPMIYVFFHKAENLMWGEDTFGRSDIKKLKEMIVEINEDRFEIEFKLTTIFDLWTISSAFSEIILKLYPQSVLLDKLMQDFAVDAGFDAFLLLDNNSLILANYYKNDESKEILQASTPYFLTLLDSWKPFKTIEKKHMKVMLNNYTFFFLEIKNFISPLYFLVMSEYSVVEPNKLEEFGKVILGYIQHS